MCGQTDLDILVDRKAHSKIVRQLISSNFKRFQAKLPSSYPAVEDWIGFDDKTGKLVHLHLHWQLTAGEPNLKGYRIPWEHELLAGRVYDSEHNIFIASHEMEMLLLLVRAALKYRFRDKLKSLIGRPYPSETGDIAAEYTWLRTRLNLDSVIALTSKLFAKDIQHFIYNFLIEEDRFNSKKFAKILPLIRSQFKQYRSYPLLIGTFFRWYREIYARVAGFLSRKTSYLFVRRRTPATGGLLIAFMGADGSGKSTQVKQTLKWLGWKFDVGHVYFGSGDGPVSLLRKPLVIVRRRKKAKSGEKISSSNGSSSQKKRLSLKSRVFTACWALSLINEKQKRLMSAIRARNMGMVVICDRFPQNQISGFNDGPIMSDWVNDSWTWSQLAKYELKKFEQFCSISPDLVIKLNVSEEVSAARKNDTPPEMIAKKIDFIKKVKFTQSVKVVELNADMPLDEISLAVRREIWTML